MTRTCSSTSRCLSEAAERDLERALLDQLQNTLLAFGQGRAWRGVDATGLVIGLHSGRAGRLSRAAVPG